jgi:hypothetical protein
VASAPAPTNDADDAAPTAAQSHKDLGKAEDHVGDAPRPGRFRRLLPWVSGLILVRQWWAS